MAAPSLAIPPTGFSAPPSAPNGLGEASIRVRPLHGDGPRPVRVRWLWHGAPGAPTVIVQGGISASRRCCTVPGDHEPGWWNAFVGHGRAVDLSRFRVLGIDWLTDELGPVAAVSSQDQADALAGVLDTLGIDRVHAFIGASYGAMVGLAFAAAHPARVDRLVAISGAHRAHPMASAQRSVQRELVRFGQRLGATEEALGLARRLAVTSYRSEEEFAQRFTGAPTLHAGRFQLPVEAYLEACGQKFTSRFSPDRFLALSESIDLHQVDPARIRTPTTLIGIPSDRLVPLDDLRHLLRALGATSTLHVVPSLFGHDAFLKEPERLGPLLREALDR